MGGVGVDVAGDGGSELGWCLGLVGCGERDQHPVVDLVWRRGDMDAVGSQGVAVGVGQAADQPGQAQPAQVVGHLSGAVVAAEQPGGQDPQVLVGEPGRSEQRVTQGAGQSHDPRIAKPQGWGPAPRRIHDGVRDPLKGWTSKDTALADPLEHAGSADYRHDP